MAPWHIEGFNRLQRFSASSSSLSFLSLHSSGAFAVLQMFLVLVNRCSSQPALKLNLDICRVRTSLRATSEESRYQSPAGNALHMSSIIRLLFHDCLAQTLAFVPQKGDPYSKRVIPMVEFIEPHCNNEPARRSSSRSSIHHTCLIGRKRVGSKENTTIQLIPYLVDFGWLSFIRASLSYCYFWFYLLTLFSGKIIAFPKRSTCL